MVAETDTLLHLLAGGCSGTLGAILTCPLDVLKTRLQSSGLSGPPVFQGQLGTVGGTGVILPSGPGAITRPGPLRVLRSILEKEGARSLFRGLGPNLVGVAPSRAVYFAAYSKSKEMFNGVFVPDSGAVHVSSAGLAAFVTNSLMNPVWMVKTRMQLEGKARGERTRSALQCARHVYATEGAGGFYRGLTASYAGISETVICFLMYETLKKRIIVTQRQLDSPDGVTTKKVKGASDFFKLMMAAAVSKGCASCLAYPHEVIRTRLREEGSRYTHLLQTGRLVLAEEGLAAFYRGLLPQLIRQIPNTAIVLSSYELIVYLLENSK